jgi:hypothetical protein
MTKQFRMLIDYIEISKTIRDEDTSPFVTSLRTSPKEHKCLLYTEDMYINLYTNDIYINTALDEVVFWTKYK